MRLPAFDYFEPSTVEEAVGLLVAHPGAMVVAGGTDLYPNMKRRQVRPAALISLGAVPGIAGITPHEDGAVQIGALTLLRDLASSAAAPAVLAHAAGEVASPQIRNAATVGGNLCVDTRCNYINMTQEWRAAAGSCLKDGGDTCWVAPRGNECVAVSSSDLAPVAIALGASVCLIGPGGEREIPVSALLQRDGVNHLTRARDEILVKVLVPPTNGTRASYRKLRRRGAIDFPILGVAVAVRTSEDGTLSDARIVIGAVAAAPFRASEAEAALIGRRLEPSVIEEAATLASQPVRPLDNTDLGSRYRKWMAATFVARALQDVS